MTLVAVPTAVALVLVGALHVIWMFSPWPLRTREEFARKVVDVPPEKLPTPTLTAAVAVLLAVAAYLVVAKAGLVPLPAWMATAGTVGVGVVMLLRGAGGLVVSSRRRTDFARLDLRVYSPLCLALAAGCGLVAFG